MKYRSDARIGIVGAGPAGLTAAETLRAKGYKHITLFERALRAGGKCHSITYEGRSYELGAGIVSDSNRTIRDLAKKFGVEMKAVDFSSRMYLDIRTGKALHKSPLALMKLLKQVYRYRELSRRYQKLAEPGFANVDKELCAPFSVWAEKNGIGLLAKEFANYYTGFGYGFLDEVSAAYVLKYYPWDIVNAYLKKSFIKFPSGIQSLWTAVAKDHDVKYGTEIKKIERNDKVTITTDEGVVTLDALILASPLDEALNVLDATPEETALFSKILTYDYRTYAVHVKGIPKKTGYIPGNLTSTRIGHPVFWYLRYSDSDLYTFYLFGDGKLSDAEALQNIKQVVEKLGGTLEG